MKKLAFIALALTLMGCQQKQEMPQGEKIEAQAIETYTGTTKEALDLVQTVAPYISLTFNGMGDEAKMDAILAQLQQSKIKVTFFLPAIRVAEQPEIAKKIMAAGHEVESNLLNDVDHTKLTYEQLYEEVALANDVFTKQLERTPRYVRTRSGDVPKDLPKVVAKLGMERAVTGYINPLDRNMQSAEEIAAYVQKYLTRGSTIMLNSAVNPEVIKAIPLIADAAKNKQYEFVTIDTLNKEQNKIKPLEEIAGYDAIQINKDYENVVPHMFTTADTQSRQVALTFDDWASEDTVLRILDILDEYQIKATFFIIGHAVEKNPALARIILNRGHDVASHSYGHKDLRTMTPAEIQDDMVKAHHAITEALQEQPKLYMRPAQGLITDEIAKIVAATGYQMIALYDIASFDWNPELTRDDIVSRVLTRVQPGSVIVMHIMDNRKTAEALPIIIERLQSQGYAFVKMADWVEN